MLSNIAENCYRVVQGLLRQRFSKAQCTTQHPWQSCQGDSREGKGGLRLSVQKILSASPAIKKSEVLSLRFTFNIIRLHKNRYA